MAHQHLLPIVLSVKRSDWRMKDSHASEADLEFSEVRASILERDDHTCRFCNFRSIPTKKGACWQDVHHLNDDHADNRPDNLVTACPFCHQCFHLGLAGLQRGGTLIWLPELRQHELNNLVRALFCAIRTGSEYEGSAKTIYRILESRSAHLEDVFGEGASDPGFLGQAMIEMSDAEYANRHEVLASVRLLPKPKRFMAAIDHWTGMVSAKIPPDTWERIAEPFLATSLSTQD
jgi:intracellular multiplication protein IcmJ